MLIVIVGGGLTVTFVVAELTQPEAFVTLNVYTPPIELLTFEIVGFCKLLINPLGPVHV